MASETHTILVVDDHQNNRDLMRRRLEREGYRVLEAENGPEGIEIVLNESVDLVLLDVMMPGLSGIEVLEILRRTYSAAELPIIIATAKNQSEDMVEALSHGANDYVTKPLDFPVVLARVEAQLRTRAASGPLGGGEATNLGAIGAGTVLAGKYRLETQLGAGNFGAVYRATHLDFDQPVAVKILRAPVEESSESLARFRQEGTSAFRLKHPNVVSVLDFNFSQGTLAFLVMELLEGHSLEQELKLHGQLSPERCGEIILPICDALSEAHGLGIIHRDIKPANIYLHQTRRGEVVKVLDFGIAKLVGDAAMEKNLTLDNGILGTPAFMAPERLQGGDYDGRSDVYSLGVMLYQLLAGHPPFQSEKNEAMAVAVMHLTRAPEPLRTHRPDISPALEDVVMATLAKDSKQRPTVGELARRLKHALATANAVEQEGPKTVSMAAIAVPPSTSAGAGSEAETQALAPPASPDADFDLSKLLEIPEIGSEAPLPVFAPPELGEPWT